MPTTIEAIVNRWADPNMRPLFKGKLIDVDGCCCAQGDVLRVCGWSDTQLRSTQQEMADRQVAHELGISVAHAVLLRQINDKTDGCPQDVLAHPEKILGDQATLVLAFWRHLESTAWDATGYTSTAVSRAAALDAASRVAGDARSAAAWNAILDAVFDAAFDDPALGHATAPALEAGRAAAGATSEIQGMGELSKFCFLPIFGIANHAELKKLLSK